MCTVSNVQGSALRCQLQAQAQHSTCSRCNSPSLCTAVVLNLMSSAVVGVAVLGESRLSTSMLPRFTVGVGALPGAGDGAAAVAAAAAGGAAFGVAAANGGGAPLQIFQSFPMATVSEHARVLAVQRGVPSVLWFGACMHT